jgi:outer membrane autotransporter protein
MPNTIHRAPMGPAQALRRRYRAAILAGTAALAVGAAATPILAQAQSRYDALTVFGDSYAAGRDNIFNAGNPLLYPAHGAAPETLTGPEFITFPYYLQRDLKIADGRTVNYAIPGATTDVLNVIGPPLSLPFELNTWNDRRFGANELVLLSIGGNDGLGASGGARLSLGYGPDGSNFGTAEATLLANQTADRALASIKRLSSAGARNLLVTAFSDLGALPRTGFTPHPQSTTVFSQIYWQRTQADLVPLAESGTRVFLFDATKLMKQVQANLSTYGFETYRGVPGLKSYFGVGDDIHLSSAGMELSGAYLANYVGAPDTVAAQAEAAQGVGEVFNAALARRLRARVVGEAARDGVTLAALQSRSPQARQAGAALSPPTQLAERTTLFASALYATQSRDDRFGAYGFDDTTAGILAGLEYQASGNWRLGAAAGYARTDVDLNQGVGKITLDSYQLALYAAIDQGGWFADGVVSYGKNDYDLSRRGVISAIKGQTEGHTLALDAHAGYLFDVASFRLGPIVGLRHGRTGVDRYAEQGDPMLIYAVSQQDLKSTIASAGVELRLPSRDGRGVEPFVDLTAEHELEDGPRTVRSVADQAPLLPIYSPVPAVGDRTFGRLSGGVSAPLGRRVSFGVDGAVTFGRQEAEELQFGAWLRVAL